MSIGAPEEKEDEPEAASASARVSAILEQVEEATQAVEYIRLWMWIVPVENEEDV